MKRFLMVAAILVLAGCSQPDRATELLRQQGYRDIRITGHDFFTCSHDEFISTGFIATSAAGATVKGAVCSGFLFKGATIRFD